MKSFELVLPKPFVYGDRRAVGKIERPALFDHGNAHALLFMADEEFFVDPPRLLAEYEIVPFPESRFRIGTGSLIKPYIPVRCHLHFLEAVVHGNVYKLPIIESRPF